MDKLLHSIDIFLTPFYLLVSFVDTLLNVSEKIVEKMVTNRLAGVVVQRGGRHEMEAGTRNANSRCNLGHMSKGNYNSSHAFSRSRTGGLLLWTGLSACLLHSLLSEGAHLRNPVNPERESPEWPILTCL